MADVPTPMLRPALELAMAVIRLEEQASPASAPGPLRPLLRFAKLPERALATVARVLDDDPGLRAHISDAADPEKLDKASWLWLSRPEGWSDELERLAGEASATAAATEEQRAENVARRRLATVQAALTRTQEELRTAQEAASEAARQLQNERQAVRETEAGYRREIAQLRAELHQERAKLHQERAARGEAIRAGKEASSRAEARATLAEARLAEAESRAALAEARLALREGGPAGGPAGGAAGTSQRTEASREGGREAGATGPLGGQPAGQQAATAAAVGEPKPGPSSLTCFEEVLRVALGATQRFSASLADAAEVLHRAGPAMSATGIQAPASPVPASAVPASAALDGSAATGQDPNPEPLRAKGALLPAESPARRRVALTLPAAVFEDSSEAAEHLVRAPGVLVLVDGYNVTLSAWPNLTIAQGRERLSDALEEFAMRCGVAVQVVFDGADDCCVQPTPTSRRVVKVSFSPAGVEADQVIIEMVEALPPGRPVVVATDDRRVRHEVGRRGANVVSTGQLLGLLGRSGAAG